MAEHKIDKKLVESPVEYTCGDPNARKHPGATEELYGLKGPEGLAANGGIEFALVYEDITPSAKADKPSDTAQFKGESEV
jgi:hypothetical protein